MLPVYEIGTRVKNRGTGRAGEVTGKDEDAKRNEVRWDDGPVSWHGGIFLCPEGQKTWKQKLSSSDRISYAADRMTRNKPRCKKLMGDTTTGR